MKNLTIETTRYMMDAMAYAYVAATLAKTGETPDPKEVDKVVRDLFQLYCFGEQLAPADMSLIGSLADIEDEDYDEDDYEEGDEYDDEEYEDENENDGMDADLTRICEALIQSLKKG